MGWFSGFRAVSFAADSGPARIGRLGTSVEDAAWSCQTIATTCVSPAGLASRPRPDVSWQTPVAGRGT